MNRSETPVTKEIILVDGRLTPEGRAELIADVGIDTIRAVYAELRDWTIQRMAAEQAAEQSERSA